MTIASSIVTTGLVASNWKPMWNTCVKCLTSLLIPSSSNAGWLKAPKLKYALTFLLTFPPRSQLWQGPSWTPHPMTTTAASTRFLTPRPAFTRPPLPPQYTASRMSHSPCPAMPSGSGSPSSPPSETLWWLALSTPALSDKHMLTKTNTHTHTHTRTLLFLDPWVRPCFVDRHIHSLYVSLSLSLCPLLLAFGSVWAPESVEDVILHNDI